MYVRYKISSFQICLYLLGLKPTSLYFSHPFLISKTIKFTSMATINHLDHRSPLEFWILIIIDLTSLLGISLRDSQPIVS